MSSSTTYVGQKEFLDAVTIPGQNWSVKWELTAVKAVEVLELEFLLVVKDRCPLFFSG